MTTESELKQQMTRYLLGELSDAEQAALEQRYFTDPRLFTKLSEIETDLADDYARGQLTTAQRLSFEQRYLANPHLRERAALSQSLHDHFHPPQSVMAIKPLPARGALWDWLTRPLAVGVLATTVAILAVISLVWWRETVHMRQELIALQASKQQAENDRTKLEKQLADERTKAAQTQNELAQSQLAATSTFATLLLETSGERATNTDSVPHVNIPSSANRLRVKLTVPDTNEYRSFRVLLQSADGAKLWQRQNIKPRRLLPSAIFSFEIPANIFQSKNYFITLTGVTAQGDADEISQSLFRVTKN